jgi:hypothetical protein
MSDLETNKLSILLLESEALIEYIIRIRTKRRESIIYRAKLHKSKANSSSKPKPKDKPAQRMVQELSIEQMQELLTTLQDTNG